MVVVVTDPVLVEGRRPGGLDAADKALLDQQSQGVVHRLSRDGADIDANVLGDGIRRTVWPTPHRPQRGQALGRDLDTVLAKERGWIFDHDWVICPIVDAVQYVSEANLFADGRWISLTSLVVGWLLNPHDDSLYSASPVC